MAASFVSAVCDDLLVTDLLLLATESFEVHGVPEVSEGLLQQLLPIPEPSSAPTVASACHGGGHAKQHHHQAVTSARPGRFLAPVCKLALHCLCRHKQTCRA